MQKLIASVCLSCLWTVAASAQSPVKNPSQMEFTSPDHAQLTAYEVDIQLSAHCPIDAGAQAALTCTGAPEQTLTIPQGNAASQPNGDWRLTINVQPIKFGLYRFVVRGVAGPLKSIDSVPSDEWQRVPGAPSKPVVK